MTYVTQNPFLPKLLLGICFLSEEVESIVQGGDRGLRGKEGQRILNAEF